MTNDTIEFYVALASKKLSHISEIPKREAQWLLMHACQCTISYIRLHEHTCLNKQYVNLFMHYVSRRAAGEPLAYIMKKQNFFDMTLTVNPDVLIPRSDTEVVVEKALNLSLNNKHNYMLDLGTGSGAIALILSRKYTYCMAVDRCHKALNIAKKNALQHSIENITFLQSNWFSNIPLCNQFDLIISNPPYIDKSDPDLCTYVKNYEPDIALISEKNGLLDLTLIISSSKKYLKNKGYLILEHGYKQGASVEKILKGYDYQDIERIYDLSNNWRGTLACYTC